MKVRHILVAPYAFKGTLTASDAAACIADGVARLDPRIQCRLLPLGDGGSGTLDALVHALGGRIFTASCTGALGIARGCRWGLAGDGSAILEAAQAIALADVPADRRDPSRCTTAGLGEMLRLACDALPARILIGLGDTATHDCGLGVGSRLGYRFLDRHGRELPPVGHSLSNLAAIVPPACDALPAGPPVVALCDVMNPLLGPDGAALRFAGQKGADPAMIASLEEGGIRFAEVVRRDLGLCLTDVPGAGAAGGLGAGLMAFAGATLVAGAAGVLDAVGFDTIAVGCDCIITGEGTLDAKTLLGKGVMQVVERAQALKTPVLVIPGRVEGDRHVWEARLGVTIAPLEEEAPGQPDALRSAAAVAHGLGRCALRAYDPDA